MELIEHMSKAHVDDALGSFFSQLLEDVKADHDQLHNLMSALGFDESGVKNAGAWMAEKVGRAKLGFSAGEDAKLRLLQSLESLYMGITGKRLLWSALDAVKNLSPVLQKTDFERLEMRALEQAGKIDRKRLETAREGLRAN